MFFVIVSRQAKFSDGSSLPGPKGRKKRSPAASALGSRNPTGRSPEGAAYHAYDQHNRLRRECFITEDSRYGNR